MDRRAFITSSAAAAALSTLPARSAFAQNSAGTAAAPSPGDARLNAAFDQVLRETVRQSPEFATSLGSIPARMPICAICWVTNSYAAIAKDLARNRKAQALVTAVDPCLAVAAGPHRSRSRPLQYLPNMAGPEKFAFFPP